MIFKNVNVMLQKFHEALSDLATPFYDVSDLEMRRMGRGLLIRFVNQADTALYYQLKLPAGSLMPACRVPRLAGLRDRPNYSLLYPASWSW